MSSSNYRFTLDMQKDQSQISLPVRLGDTDRRLYISLTNGGSPYYIKDGCLALFVGLKSDGNDLANHCIIENNSVIRYDFTEQTANAEGVVDCEIRLFDSEGELITSPRFIMVVDSRVVNDDVALSESEHNIIDKIAQDELARVTAETARNDNEASRCLHETEREASEETRRLNEATRVSNEETRNSNESRRGSDEYLRQEAEINRVANENARDEAENGRTLAEENRVLAENIRASNENNRISSENARVKAESYRNQRVTELAMYLTGSEVTIPTADSVVNELVNKSYLEGTIFICETGAVTYITYTKEPIEGATYINPTSLEWLMGTLSIEPNKAYYVSGKDGTAYFKTSSDFVPEQNTIEKRLDGCANAIKASASGEVVRVADVSPNEHIIGCKVRSKNLFNDLDDYKGYEHTYTDRTLTVLGKYTNKFIMLEDGKTYTFSCKSTRTGEAGGGAYLRAYTEDKSAYIDLGSDISILSPTLTATLPKGYPCLRITFYGYYSTDDADTGDATYTELMLEEGSEATGYVPYVDIATATVTRCGKNLIPFPYYQSSSSANGGTITVQDDSGILFEGTPTGYVGMVLYKGKALVKSGEITMSVNGTAKNVILILYMYDSSGELIVTRSTTNTIVLNMDSFPTVTDWNITCARAVTNEAMSGVMYPQIEVGTVVTEFELYKGATFTPKSDCSVEGIKSVAPTMTLLTDTANVVIEIEYNQDSNAVVGNVRADIEELDRVQAEIIEDIGDIETALDSIIAMQSSLIGGDA